ncbi:MAG: radical SAM protein [Tannerella sp.]|jgi:MoaA/NifB/PqqE/SkfB family radical SAM enzyme|nr:radical SAM protein [Tannerella sp.]
MIKNAIKRLVPRRLILFRRSLIPLLRKISRRNLKRKQLIPILHIHLADHCNLNCRGCDNFSPLSPEVFAAEEVVERDCARIAELTGGVVNEIQLLGGEPLLHPRAYIFIYIARKYFPSSPIKLVTNGILLPKQTEQFWDACRCNNIEIVVTKYPIKIDHDAIRQHVIAQGVAFSFYGNTEAVPKTMQCAPLDLEGKQDPRDSFLRCNSANRCIALDNGRIYTCSLIPYVKYFNATFGTNLNVTDKDYISIDDVASIDEIMQFLCRPMPFCRYCNRKGMIRDIGYGVSRKDISEWTG